MRALPPVLVLGACVEGEPIRLDDPRHHVAIPAVADVIEVEVVVERDAEDTVGLHLHNHDVNSWTLGVVHLLPRKLL